MTQLKFVYVTPKNLFPPPARPEPPYIRSGTMSMAPQGHSAAQRPQPLQKS